MPEAKATKSKTKTKTSKKKNGKSPKSKKSKTKTPAKKLPPSRRNEIWESLSDDLSETPSSPTDAMIELDDWSDTDDLKEAATIQQSSRFSSMSRVDMSGSIHSGDEDWNGLMDDADDDDSLMDEDYIAGDQKDSSRLPVAPFVSSSELIVDDGKKPAAEMSLKELKAELQSYGIPPHNFLEKIEMIKAVKDARMRDSNNSSRRQQTPRNQGDDTLRSRSVSVVSNTSGPLKGGAETNNRYAEQDIVIYTSSNGTTEVATILKVHLDDELVPFYDIRLKDSGKEKQTDDGHLSPLPTRQQSGHIPDAIAFDLNDEDVADYEGEFFLQSPSFSEIRGDYDDEEEYAEISHHSRIPNNRKSSLSSSYRSPGQTVENSTRSRRSTASAPVTRKHRHSMDSPHQTKTRVRNSDYVSGYNASSSRRGSNMSPTRPPRLNTDVSPTRTPRSTGNLSPTRPPQRSSTNHNTSPTRPPSSRRRDSTESYHARPSSMRASNSSPTRPPSCRRRDSTESYHHARPSSMRASRTSSPTRPPSCRRRESTESNPGGRPLRASTGGRHTGASVRSSSPLPPKRPGGGSTRHHSAPLSPVRTSGGKKVNNNKNLSPKRPTTNRKADLSPKRPKSSVRSPTTSSDKPAPYGHSLGLLNLKKRMSS